VCRLCNQHRVVARSGRHDLPSTRPAQPKLSQVAWAVQKCHEELKQIEEKNKLLVGRECRRNSPYKAQLGVQLCAKHDGGRHQMKSRKRFACWRFRFWRHGHQQMACITSAKPPGTSNQVGRPSTLSCNLHDASDDIAILSGRKCRQASRMPPPACLSCRRSS